MKKVRRGNYAEIEVSQKIYSVNDRTSHVRRETIIQDRGHRHGASCDHILVRLALYNVQYEHNSSAGSRPARPPRIPRHHLSTTVHIRPIYELPGIAAPIPDPHPTVPSQHDTCSPAPLHVHHLPDQHSHWPRTTWPEITDRESYPRIIIERLFKLRLP